MQVIIYRFHKGSAGGFDYDTAIDAEPFDHYNLAQRGASSVLKKTMIRCVEIGGELCLLEKEQGHPCVFLPAKGKKGR